MPPLLYALALVAALIGLGLAVLGTIGGALALVTIDDRNVQRAGVAVAGLSLAAFVAIAALLPKLVLQ